MINVTERLPELPHYDLKKWREEWLQLSGEALQKKINWFHTLLQTIGRIDTHRSRVAGGLLNQHLADRLWLDRNSQFVSGALAVLREIQQRLNTHVQDHSTSTSTNS